MEFIFSVLLLLAIGYVVVRIIGDILKGVVIISLVLLASYFFTGSFPEVGNWLKKVSEKRPYIGKFVSFLKPGGGLEIVGVSRDENGYLLIAVKNDGYSSKKISNVYVDGKKVTVLNPQVIEPGTTKILKLKWKGIYRNIELS